MARRNRNGRLAPGAATALENLKFEVAAEVGAPPEVTVSEAAYQQHLDNWKYEIASELNLKDKINSLGWGEMTSRECGRIGGRMGGKIGGNMVRRMIEYAERNMR
ncbi:MAG: alpha/beta-type small acid-soluble spore protein [Bacillota bacterium]